MFQSQQLLQFGKHVFLDDDIPYFGTTPNNHTGINSEPATFGSPPSTPQSPLGHNSISN